MLKLSANIICALSVGIALISSLPSSLTAAEPDELVHTAYLVTDYGLGTYKSELMESNDTNGIVTYGVGTYAGSTKNLGVE